MCVSRDPCSLPSPQRQPCSHEIDVPSPPEAGPDCKGGRERRKQEYRSIPGNAHVLNLKGSMKMLLYIYINGCNFHPGHVCKYDCKCIHL